MNGRPKTFDDHSIIEKAQRVFWKKGYASTSTDELLVAMGIGRGSFYLAFKDGKKELFLKTIRQFHNKGINKLKADINASDNAIEIIREFFNTITKSKTDRHLNGCFIGNTLVEMASQDEDIREEAIAILKELEQVFYKAILAGQKNGQLKTKTDARLLARQLITIWNGLNVTRRMYPSQTILKSLIEIQLQILI